MHEERYQSYPFNYKKQNFIYIYTSIWGWRIKVTPPSRKQLPNGIKIVVGEKKAFFVIFKPPPPKKKKKKTQIISKGFFQNKILKQNIKIHIQELSLIICHHITNIANIFQLQFMFLMSGKFIFQIYADFCDIDFEFFKQFGDY